MVQGCRLNVINVKDISYCPVIQTSRHPDTITEVQVSLLFPFSKTTFSNE